MPSKSAKRCKKGSRKCHKRCVTKKAYVKTKKCASGSRKCHDQLCHRKPAEAVKSTYALRSRRGM
jgi:hypothetical protein